MATTPSAPATRSYTFTAQCRSGQQKSTTFIASNYSEARQKLQEFIDNN